VTVYGDSVFDDAISRVYERYLVPLIFQPYAELMAARVAKHPGTDLLEMAAGTGVLTRAMASRLPTSTTITATDLNQAMLDQARHLGTSRPVEWRQADAMALPFDDQSFDIVVSQFGAMFFPDKAKAFSEARRVLRDGGMLVFTVWDRIEENEFADAVTNALESVFPSDPPRFLARVPHGYFDRKQITADLKNAGFAKAHFETVAARSTAESADFPAIAYCQGTPLRTEIEKRDKRQLREATRVAADAVRARFGSGNVDGKIQAHVVTTRR
jgi:ubiquinone/menaquinone biosynthesis C-methylase UbiE